MFIVLRQLETALRAMKNYIDKIVPRKVSDLQNDAEYITETDIPTDVSGFTNDVGYITSADVPTPDWTATSSEPGYIDNKPNILPGAGQMSIQTNAGHTVTGTQSASFGAQNNVSGNFAFSAGVENNVSGGEAFAAGNYNIANHESQFVFGQFNAADSSNTESSIRGTYIEIVGNGNGVATRSNARTLDWEGNQWIAGNFKMGGSSYDDPNAKGVATKEYVDSEIAGIDLSSDYASKSDYDWSIAHITYDDVEEKYTVSNLSDAEIIEAIDNGKLLVEYSNDIYMYYDFQPKKRSFRHYNPFENKYQVFQYILGTPTPTSWEYYEFSPVLVSDVQVNETSVVNNGVAEISVTTPDWKAAEGEDGYIANKPLIKKGTGSNSIITGTVEINQASGPISHAEGYSTTASGNYSHAEGNQTTASGIGAHAEGYLSTASGKYSSTEGYRTSANHRSQHASGEYNIEDPSTEAATARGTYVEIVGNGTGAARSNARTLDWSGNEWLAGNLKVGGTGYTDANAKEVATKDYVDTAIADIDVSGSKIISGTWTTPQSGQPYLDYDDSSMSDEALIGLLNNGESVTLEVNFPDVNIQTDTRYFYLKGKTTAEESGYSLEWFAFWSMPSVGESGSANYISMLIFMHQYNSSVNAYVWNYDEMPFPVKDVTINGTSIVGNNGVAEIPVASSGVYGVMKPGPGLKIDFSYTVVNKANANQIKNASTAYNPIVPDNQHESTFYGLAKAAGDTTQSASSNAVGTYTDNAKASIKAMLGVGGETQKVTVSGTAPTIVANQNTRYVCGEVVSLDFTPSAEGICDVIFTSGSTVTVLTIPNTVIFPEWFDPTTLEANKTYEINITDGVYGAVMIW